jgi:hypothetical protein
MQLIADDELERLAAEHGPDSYPPSCSPICASAAPRMSRSTVSDSAEYLVVCPMPTPDEEAQLKLAYEAIKHMKGSKLTNIADVIAAWERPMRSNPSAGYAAGARRW